MKYRVKITETANGVKKYSIVKSYLWGLVNKPVLIYDAYWRYDLGSIWAYASSCDDIIYDWTLLEPIARLFKQIDEYKRQGKLKGYELDVCCVHTLPHVVIDYNEFFKERGIYVTEHDVIDCPCIPLVSVRRKDELMGYIWHNIGSIEWIIDYIEKDKRHMRKLNEYDKKEKQIVTKYYKDI